MSTALQQYDAGSMTQWRDPEEVLSQAQKAAVALRKVLDLKVNKVMFNNEQYLEREDWGTVGRFFGCTAKSIETHYVEYPDGSGGLVRGFEAVAVVIDMNTEHQIGRAESMCLDEEDSWGEVAVYEWKDKLDKDGKKIWNPNLRKGKGGYEAEKVQTGTKSKPLFQLRSMAQTRAEAKALKSVFGWVVVLAGYKPTPAEELTGHEDFDRQERPPVQQPQSTNGNGEKITGVIESVKQAASGHLWLTVDKKIVFVNANRADDAMKAGATFSAKVHKLHHDQIGDYWEADAILDAPVQTVPDAAKGNQEVEELVESGQVQRGSDMKPATIGPKRAQRIYKLAGLNSKNTGFTETVIKKLLSMLPVPLEHLSDLEPSMEAAFEKYATGEDASWKEILEGA